MSTAKNPHEISAFAVYNSEAKATNSKKNTNSKNSKQMKTPKAVKRSKNNGTPARNVRKIANLNKSKSKPIGLPNLNGTLKSQKKKSKQSHGKLADVSVKANNKGKQANRAKNKARQGSKEQIHIDPNEVDGLVEELLAVDCRKLTKEQRKKRHEIENYLIKQLENDVDSHKARNEEESCFSDEFSDEYTINSSSISPDENSCHDSAFNQVYHGENVVQAEKSTNRVLKDINANQSNKGKRRNVNDLSNAHPSNLNKKARLTKVGSSISENSKKEIQSGGILQPSSDEASCATSSYSPIMKSVKIEPLSPTNNPIRMNSIEKGRKLFEWLIHSVNIDEFFSKYWEKKVCLVKRNQPDYYAHLISFNAIDQMLLKHHVEFTKNLDITSYQNGVRSTHNPEGRALPPLVWHHYSNGNSIRLLNPQAFITEIYSLSAALQEYFHCLVGANVYLTPPNTQGFAPHYDDIEAFVLQIEGCKRWKLYRPRNTAEVLPRYSSQNFQPNEIGEPIMNEILKPGDMLYFPRGTIHQASAEADQHSLHITLSVYQRQTYGDLLEQMLPAMLQKAIATNLDLRRGLPLQCWQHVGMAYSDSNSEERSNIQKNVQKLLRKCMTSLPLTECIDSAFDQLAKRFQHEALPPEISPLERDRTMFGSRNLTNERGECLADYEIDPKTTVRLLRANIIRLVGENDSLHLYYYMDNSKSFCEYEANFIDIDNLQADCVKMLLKAYPEYIRVEQLPLEDNEQKVDFATALWERGLLMMENPL